MDNNDSNDDILIEEEDENNVAIALMDKKDSQTVGHDYSDSEIRAMIYVIREQQVMLDSDLAKLYDYELKKMNQKVKRNIDRFPEDFMFQLTMEEAKNLPRSHFVTLVGKGTNTKYAPYVFTEHGVNQLSAVLKSSVAIKQSIHIMRTFVKMRHYLIENQQLLGSTDILKITNTLIEDNIKIKEKIDSNYQESKNEIDFIKENMTTKDDMEITMNKIMDSFIPKESIKQYVFKDDQMFEANVAYIDIYKEANHSVYIIDDYINCQTLSLLTAKKDGVDVVVFSDNKGRGSEKLNELEFNNFNREYPNLSIKRNNRKCHDRFIILDYKTEAEKIYHCDASSKDAGRKACCISSFLTSDIIHSIIDELLTNEDYVF